MTTSLVGSTLRAGLLLLASSLFLSAAHAATEAGGTGYVPAPGAAAPDVGELRPPHPRPAG